jgi:uncharacterized membrane protein
MATYTPKALVEQVALTGSNATYYTAPSVAVARTIQFSTPSAGKTVTLSLKADAAGTRIFEALPLTANQATVQNGWWVITNGATVQALVNSTAASIGIYGYEYA